MRQYVASSRHLAAKLRLHSGATGFHTVSMKRRGRGELPEEMPGWRSVQAESQSTTADDAAQVPAAGRGERHASELTGWPWGCLAAADTAAGTTAGEGAEPGVKRPGQETRRIDEYVCLLCVFALPQGNQQASNHLRSTYLMQI